MPRLCGSVPAQVVEHRHVGVHVVQVVGVGGVVLHCPVDRQGAVQIEDVVFWFGLVVHAVKPVHLDRGKRQDGHPGINVSDARGQRL